MKKGTFGTKNLYRIRNILEGLTENKESYPKGGA